MSVGRRSIDMPTWQHRRDARDGRIEAGAKLASGKIVEVHNATRLMEAVVSAATRHIHSGSIYGVGRRFQSCRINDLELVDQTGGSWNQLAALLRQLDRLREPA